jgi:Fusaric acid resistance protein-like
MSAVAWLRERDRGLSALRRAGRAALVMPAMFALGDVVIANPAVATFAAFGSFAMLLLVDFPGPMRARLQAQAALAATGGVFVCVGTLASRSPGLAAVAMALVAFGVIFAGVVSSVLAGATTSLLLAFILPVSLPGPISQIPDRLAGWGLASAAALLAIALLWPAPARDPVRSAAIAGTRAVAHRLRAQVAYVVGGRADALAAERDAAIAQADSAVEALHAVFFATPYRPTGLSTAARAVVRLVDELKWLNTIVLQAAPHPHARAPDAHVAAVKTAAAAVLERGGDLLDAPQRSPDALHAALTELRARLSELERAATSKLPAATATTGGTMTERPAGDVISSLDPAFRAQELSFVVSQIAMNIDWAAAAERRSWLAQMLGRQPEGLAGPFSAAHERAGAHVEQHSLWLQNSIRGAVGLGLAVLIANLTGVQQAFWVVLGTLSVLRSNALSTGQNVLRGLLGTVAGFVVGGALVELVGTNTTLLWVLLPPAVLLAGLAPATISFAAGQAAFTLALLILFNILAPEGWQIGLVRIEDVAIGGAVSLAVGLLLWPRGAGHALGTALAQAYAASAEYLASATRFGSGRCDAVALPAPAPTEEAARAAAAARRLDDTFRSYLAERGAKPVPLAEITSLVTGVVGLRLAGDAVLDLWRQDGSGDGDRTAARRELSASTEQMTRWYRAFAVSLTGDGPVPEPLEPDALADQRLVDAVGHDLRGHDGHATATAVRMIWTGDHLDAARRLQGSLIEPARTAASVNALR